ncbi:unnamed protein product [Tilletia controversa]|nr:unnamed protein product [Tilletia controversa]
MNKTLNLSTSYMSSESDDVSMLSSLSSLSSLEPLEEPVPAQAQPQPKEPSKRRRLQESDIESFFTFLDELGVSYSNLLRTLFDPASVNLDDKVQKQIHRHVRPFFSTTAARNFVKQSKGGRRTALAIVVDELRAEGKGASKLPELRRPSSMNRGDDIQTYRFGDAANTIRTQLPITFAVITAIAGVARQSGSTGQHRTDEERDLEEHELDDIWQDIDEIGHQQPSAEDEEGEPSSKQAPVSKRGKRSPMVIAMAATMMLLLARNVTISRFQRSLGLFLFASRTGRRVVEVLSRMGMSVSYLTLLRTIRELSRSAQHRARSALLDKTKVYCFGYDNINWQTKHRNKGFGVSNQMTAATHGVLYEVDTSVQLKDGPQHQPVIRRCSPMRSVRTCPSPRPQSPA